MLCVCVQSKLLSFAGKHTIFSNKISNRQEQHNWPGIMLQIRYCLIEYYDNSVDDVHDCPIDFIDVVLLELLLG
jgi:hypothetical protein